MGSPLDHSFLIVPGSLIACNNAYMRLHSELLLFFYTLNERAHAYACVCVAAAVIMGPNFC